MSTFREDIHLGHKVPLVETDDIKDGAITTDKLADGSVTEEKLADDSVTSEKIKDGEVKTPDIADEAVTTEKIADDAVTKEKMGDGAVGWDELDHNLQNIIETGGGGSGLSTEWGDSEKLGITQRTLTEFHDQQLEKDEEQDETLAAHDETLAEHTEALGDTYRKSETYSKEQLDNMITTPDQEYVTLVAESGDTLEDIFDGVTGAADTIYRVGNWDGEEYNTGSYSEYAFDGTDFKFLSKKEPGIDDEPTPNSEKLVKSGGVFEAIRNSGIVDGRIETQDELSFVDENDNCIAQFKEGHLKTKNFDSRESISPEKVAEVDNLEGDDEEVAIIDENDNCIARFKDGHIQTKYFNSRSALSNKGRGTVLEDFDGFSGNGGTVSSDKKSILISTEGAIIKHSNQHLNAWNFNLSVCITPAGATFCVGIGKYIDLDVAYYPNSSLFALEFDGETSKLVTYKPNSTGVITKVTERILNTISLASGMKFWLLVRKKTTDRSLYDVEVTDEYGNVEAVTNIYCGTGMSLSGYGWGSPCVFMLDGDSVEFGDFSFGMPISSELRCIMLGHSWIESNTQAAEHQNSFAGLVQTALGGNDYCVNMGRGGFDAAVLKDLTNTVAEKFPNAKYALIGIGLNDLKNYIETDIFGEKEVELEQNLAIIQAKLVSEGIIPIFLSLAWTWSTGKPSVDSINPWMKSNLVNVVDINKVFEDNSGNLIESAFVSDGQHPTVVSCEKIFNCIKAQAGYLFNQ